MSYNQINAKNFEQPTDYRIGELTAAVGNHEVKALAFIMMCQEPSRIYGGSDIKQLLSDSQGDAKVWVPNPSTCKDYLEESFVSIGFVARTFNRNGSVSYVVTPEGLSIGQALAGHAVDLSYRHPKVSLKDAFGMAHSKSDDGKRSPLRRIEILEELIGSELPINLTTLFAGTGGHDKSNTRKNQLRNLYESGLVTYTTIAPRDLDQRFLSKAKIGPNFPVLKEQPTLSGDVVDAINILRAQRNQADSGPVDISADEITSYLLEHESRYSLINTKNTRDRVAQVLRTLKHAALLEANVDRDSISAITLTSDQESVVRDILTIIDGLRSGSPEFIETGIAKASAILGDQEAVRSLISKSRAASPEANRLEPVEKRRMTLSALGSAALPATLKDIFLQVGTPSGSRFTERMLGDELRLMRREGLTRAIQERGITRWMVLGNESDSPELAD